MNGHALDPGGRDMRDIIAYLAFLSRGIPVGSSVVGQSFPKLAPLRGDSSRGAVTFETTCSRCHGMDGNGSAVNGSTIGVPPVWGRGSYNAGAGMASVLIAASFIQHVMPYDRPGTLSAQQAFDVATYINSQPRPTFAGQRDDWPRTAGKPTASY
jgi:thiosulfate dehydrogenase